MSWQTVFTALIVAACAVYAAWQLMPAALRTRCRTVLGWRAVAASGCGACDSCGTAAAARADGTQVVQIVRPAARAAGAPRG